MSRIHNLTGFSICLLLMVSPFVFAPSLYDFANLPQSAFIQLFVFLLMAFLCGRSVIKGRVKISLHPIHLFILLFLGWVGLSLCWSINIHEGALQFIHLGACGVVFLVVVGSALEERWIIRMLATIMIAGAGASLLGCLQFALDMDAIPQAAAPAATFANRTVAAQFVSMTLPLHPVFFFHKTRKFHRVLTGISAIISMAFLIVSETRAGWLACLAAGAFLFVALIRDSKFDDSWARISRKAAGVTIAFILASTAAVSLLYPDLPGSFFEISKNKLRHGVLQGAPPGGKESVLYKDSMDLRLGIWRNSLEMFKEHPVSGVGVGNFKIVYPAYHQRAHKDRVFRETMRLHTCHNDFLQIAVELGVVGLLLFFSLLACIFSMVFALLTPRDPPQTRLIAMGATGGLLAFLVHATFSFPLERSAPPLALFIYIAVITLYYKSSRSPVVVKTLSMPSMLKAPALVVLAGGVLLFGRFQIGSLLADRYYLTALTHEKQGNWPEVIRAGWRGLSANPFRSDILAAVGHAQVEFNQVEKGIGSLKKTLTADPYNINAMVNLGVGYHKAGQTDRAAVTFERVLEIKPDSARALANLGKILMKQGKNRKALEYFEKAAANKPRDPFLYINIGFLKYKEKEYFEAAGAYEKALSLNSELFYIHRILGVIYENQPGQKDKADYHFKKFAEANSE